MVSKTYIILPVAVVLFGFDPCFGDICCLPDQFEANVVYDDANVFIDADVGTAYR